MMPSTTQADALIIRLSRVISHELRTPMAIINNSAYFVKTKLDNLGKLDPKVAKHIGIIESEIKHANEMISEMVAYSRPLELKTVPIDITLVLKEALAGLEWSGGIKTSQKAAKGLPKISGDAEALSSVFQNIFLNSAAAIEDKGEISILAEKKGKGIVVEVKDTGSGIPDDKLEEVFLAYWTTKPKGLGLGLATARKIVEGHGGSIEAVKTGGKGAAIRVSLPA